MPYLRRALDLAAEWMPAGDVGRGAIAYGLDDAGPGFDILCVSLEAVVRHAQQRGVRFAIELHNALTARPEYLVKLLKRFGPG